VQVSHPNGNGDFRNRKVVRAQSAVFYEGAVDAARYGPSFRVGSRVVKVRTIFKLKNGNHIGLTCYA
ncbi:MAG TPA: hypothetical protein VM347_09330, partial [Nonomuraea sp.]|nr:hypothetical protein [Nonomuraea sp.]